MKGVLGAPCCGKAGPSLRSTQHGSDATMVLITGGAGFLGIHLANRFQRNGIPVRLLDTAQCPPWVQEAGIEYLRGDIRDRAAVAAAFEAVESVVHGAFASPRHSHAVIQSVNVEGTRNLCSEAFARGVRRFILISSTIVQQPRRVHPFLRNSPLTRLDMYRASRAEAEAIVADFGNKELPVAIVRPKTFLGPGRVSAFGILFEWTRLGRPVLVLGCGRNRYQLLDIRDLAEGIRLLEASDATGVFSFGAREFRTVREDLQALLDHARTGAHLRFIPGRLAQMALRTMELANIVPPSEWHSMSALGADCMVDISRAEQELNWRPVRSNTQALVEAYDWYVTSLLTTGTARSTLPLPAVHRALKGINRIFPP
jgi:nucleoside-diphosphate-sugar epimerase